jgi:cullin 1
VFIDFNILVLSAGSWPLSAPTTAFNIPEDVCTAV